MLKKLIDSLKSESEKSDELAKITTSDIKEIAKENLTLRLIVKDPDVINKIRGLASILVKERFLKVYLKKAKCDESFDGEVYHFIVKLLNSLEKTLLGDIPISNKGLTPLKALQPFKVRFPGLEDIVPESVDKGEVFTAPLWIALILVHLGLCEFVS